MGARKLAGAAVLGLVASLLAHAIAFGGGHVMGAAYHETLVAGAGVALATAIIAAVSLAWSGAGRVANGSILAARLRGFLPGWPALCATTATWLFFIEHTEPHHQPAPWFLLLIAIFVAAALVLLAVRGMLTILAAIVIALRAAPFAARSLPRTARLGFAPRAYFFLRAYRRYARPPPVFAVTGA